MNAEKLMDAMNLLPDDILERTNALRQRRHIPWKTLSALAACLCLAVGLWLLNPGTKSADSIFDAAAENAAGMEHREEISYSSTGQTHPQAVAIPWHEFSGREYVDVTVVSVQDGYMGVMEGWHENTVIDGMGTLISLEYLQQCPELSPGEHLRVYFGDALMAYLDREIGYEILLPQRVEILKEAP